MISLICGGGGGKREKEKEIRLVVTRDKGLRIVKTGGMLSKGKNSQF